MTQGHRAQHVRQLLMSRSTDVNIWEYAIKNNCIIVTKDEDFPDLALLRSELVPVVWLHIGNCRKQVLIQSFGRSWPEIFERLQRGDQIIEVY